MKAFQLIKRVGGFCNLQSLHYSSATTGIGYATTRRAPTSILLPTLLVPRHPSFAARSQLPSSPAPVTTALHQTAQSFGDSQQQQRSSFSTDANSSLLVVDQGVFDAYKEAMLDVINDFPPDKEPKKKKKKVTVEQFLQVQDFLLSNKTYSESPLVVAGDDTMGSGKNGFRHTLYMRRDAFMEATNFTEHQYEYAMRCIVTMASRCAKVKAVTPVIAAWSKIKDTGMALRPNFLSTFLYVVGLEEEHLKVSLEVATAHDLLYGSTENSAHLRIKALVGMGDPGGAEKLLNELPDDNEECKRLRTFTPIIKHYCDKGDAHSILRVWKQMRATPGCHLDSETYAEIIGSLARNHVFGRDAVFVPGADEIGLSHSCGPKLLDEIMTEMAEDLIELSEEAAVKLFNDFQAGFSSSSNTTRTDGIDKSFKEVPLCSGETGDNGLLAGRVTIGSNTALCPRTGARLRQLTLDPDQRQHVHGTLLKMSATQEKENTARYKNRTKYNFNQVAEKELGTFADWLKTREGGAFTAFVDGANVAYFGQGTVRYSQIARVVEELEKMGERPLVIMPRKYVNSSFRLGHGGAQKLAPKDLEVITWLLNQGKLFVVPAQCFDDYYWMLASVSDQNGTTLEVGGGTTRFPGIRPMLISNDQMRDHKLELLEPKLFRRWYSSQVVTYAISNFEVDEWEHRTVRFMPADFFSREIQGNVINRDGAAGTAWHLPVSGWEPRSERLCIAVEQ